MNGEPVLAGEARSRWPAALVTAVALVVWEVWGRSSGAPTLFFPAPSVIGRCLVRQLSSGELGRSLLATFGRLGWGFLLGGIPALLLGFLMGFSPRVRAVADPLVAAVHSVPKIAVLPLFMIVLGIGETSKIAVVAASAFFPLLISTMAGVRQISPIHFEVAHGYGASTLRVFWRVLLPGSLPLVFAGLRLAFNSSLLVTIAIEFVAAREGLGATIWMAWQTMRIEELYASLAVISLTGVGFNEGLVTLERRLVPWHFSPEV